MRALILIVLLGSSLTSCYTWKRSFVVESKCQKKKNNKDFDSEKVIPLDPEDFFYMKQVEYFEPYENDSDSPEPYTNEASVRLYKSVPVSYKVPEVEKVVEEKYMYVLNYSNPDAESGEVFYFRTATYWGEGKDRGSKKDVKRLRPSILHDHFANKDTIDLSTSMEIQMGFWYRDAKDSIRFLLNNGTDKYQVIATGYRDSIVFQQISHPNKDLSSRGAPVEQFVQLAEVMNVQKSTGLIYHRNVLQDTLLPEREVVVTLDSASYSANILKMRYNSGDTDDLMKAKCYIKSDDITLVQRRKHQTVMVSEANRKAFENYSVIPHRKKIKEAREKEESEKEE